MTDRADQVVTNSEKIIRRAAVAAAIEVIDRTPVKTGTARINWRVGFGGVSGTIIDGPGTANRTTNANVASASASIDAANKLAKWRRKMGEILIANPVSYIFDLDDGTSTQAASGMTIFAIAAAKDILRKGKLLKDAG